MVMRVLLVVASICFGALAAVRGAAISPVSRLAGDCGDVCMNKKAVDITNEVRCRHGECTKLISGPMVMLNNAKDWSKTQMRKGALEHQPLPKILGCQVKVMGENVAMFDDWANPNPAEKCLKQWENSPGHLENILTAQPGTMVTVGFHKEGTKVYCTQTFTKWKNGTPVGGAGECAPLSGQAPTNGPPPAKPEAPTKPEPYKPDGADKPAKPAAPTKPEPYKADGANKPANTGSNNWDGWNWKWGWDWQDQF